MVSLGLKDSFYLVNVHHWCFCLNLGECKGETVQCFPPFGSLCSALDRDTRAGWKRRGSSVKANYEILQVNITVDLPADRLLIDFITTAPKCSGHRQSSAWTWQLLVGFCGPLRKADESQFITAFEPCLPFPPVTWATKTKWKQFPPWLPLTKNARLYNYAAVFFELLSLQDLMASFAFQKNWVYNVLQWSPDSAKCLSPCLILSLQIAPAGAIKVF